jgi:hypothetical protein
LRATFIPKPVENAARLEDPKKVAGHRDSGTIKGYDWRGYNPELAVPLAYPLALFAGDTSKGIIVIHGLLEGFHQLRSIFAGSQAFLCIV